MTTLATSMSSPPSGDAAQQSGEVTTNGTTEPEIIDDDINHTVSKLFMVKPQPNVSLRGKKEPIENIVRKALQAERNHWKERLQLSMQEIDRQHRVILVIQSGLQELVKSLKHTLQKNVIFEDEEAEGDLDQELLMSRLMENLKFQIRQLKVRAGVPETSKRDFERDSSSANKQNIRDLREQLMKLNLEKEQIEMDMKRKEDKILWIQKENLSLQRQLEKMSKIVSRYNENHSGSSFHLKIVENPNPSSSRVQRKDSLTTYDTNENSVSTVRERTYIEGDQINSYPLPREESAVTKDRIRKNIYNVRKGSSSSTSVAQCLRCHALFRPGENNQRACRFHHKGREIKETFDANGKLDKVVYKWACCKKTLESQGCGFGFHV